MTADEILIDFLIPQFQDPRIIKAIESIASHPAAARFRIIVLDGGRDVALQALISASLRSHDLHRIAADRGIYDALNAGVALATAPWVGWIGSDDLLARSFPTDSLQNAGASTHFVSFTTLFFREADGAVTRVYRPVGTAFLRRNGFHLPHFSTFIRSPVAKTISFDINQKNFADQLFMHHLEGANHGVADRRVSTLMCEGGLSNSSRSSIIKTNVDVFEAMKSRKSTLGSGFYVVNKLIYKIAQRALAIVQKQNIRDFR